MHYSEIITKLKKQGVKFANGLTQQEIYEIESFYDIVFPQDLKEFLATSLPVSDHFINWRNFSESNIHIVLESLNWPLAGLIFDIENNDFWYEGWGKKPENLSDAVEVCINEFKKVPKLIPIYSHRYISSEPSEAGNPVFSVYQTDIIYYGENLLSFLEVEFGMKEHKDINFDKIRKIRFWADLVG